ncbi:MAG: hypothetical protein Q9227_008372 [Pyrenula ochraceoflavens]
MSRYIAPGMISSERDLVEYHVSDASPVVPGSPPGYSERCIHSEVFKAYPSVQSVIHSHSEAVVPYSISGVPLKACFHMAGFLGTASPVFDIAKYYQPDDRQDLLVRNTHLGAALASYFSPSHCEKEPKHSAVLMRGHGFTVLGPAIEDTVLRAVYTQQNAAIQTTALLTRAAYFGGTVDEKTVPSMAVLSEAETEGATEMTRWSAKRPWKMWVKEVETNPLYQNLVV